MSVKSKHSSTKKDKKGKKEKKKKIEETDEEIESSEEELDLTKECHPIGYYINDRAEMINQMFSVIKGNKLKAMLPPILKNCDLDQLKLQCLDQLLGMSEKRITCILEGGVLETSSESEVVESEEQDSDEKNLSTSGSSSEGSEESNEHSNGNNSNKYKKRKSNSKCQAKEEKLVKINDETSPPEQGKTLLEILELEMRARAIRALLKQSGSDKENEQGNDDTKTDDVSKNNVKESTDEVVDLTGCEDEDFFVSVKRENPEKNEIEDKMSTFEKKVEKCKSNKTNNSEKDDKSRRLQAELELRNKLFKKKIYRTRQQRMENEGDPGENEEPKSREVNATEININVKQEPVEPDGILVEDPEEGEINTSEDEYPVEIKQEKSEPEVSEEIRQVFLECKMDEDAERVTAIDNGNFVSDCNLEYPLEVVNDSVQSDKTKKAETLPLVNENESESYTMEQSNENIFFSSETTDKGNTDAENSLEETSWRHRWLQKDGVQKLVKSSKIYAKVKKRIAEKSHKAKEDTVSVQKVDSIEGNANNLEIIEGSIKEYEKLLGKTQEQKKEGENNGFQSAETFEMAIESSQNMTETLGVNQDQI